MNEGSHTPSWPTNHDDPASDRGHGDFGRLSGQCSPAPDSSVSGLWVDLDSIDPYCVIHIPLARGTHWLDGASLNTFDEAPVSLLFVAIHNTYPVQPPIISSGQSSRRSRTLLWSAVLKEKQHERKCSLLASSSTTSLPPSCVRTLFGDIGGCPRCGSLDLRWCFFFFKKKKDDGARLLCLTLCGVHTCKAYLLFALLPLLFTSLGHWRSCSTVVRVFMASCVHCLHGHTLVQVRKGP